MAQTFRWSNTRIAAYLQAEGQRISPKSVATLLADAQRSLGAALPDDIQSIYFGDTKPAEEDLPEDLANLLDVSDIDLEPLSPILEKYINRGRDALLPMLHDALSNGRRQ